MAHAFFLGVDVGGDTSDAPGAVTLALVEKQKADAEDTPSYRLDRVHHNPETDAPGDLADHIQQLVADAPYIGRTGIIVNQRTAQGEALAQALENRGLAPVRATLTGGRSAVAGDPDEQGVHIAEHAAVQTLASLYHDGRLELPGNASDDVSRLARGIQSFAELRPDDALPAGAESDAADAPQRPESFDTHVTSTALATWLGAERSFDPTQRLKETPQTEVSPHES